MALLCPLRDLYRQGSAQRTKKEVVVCMSCSCCCSCSGSLVLHGIHEVSTLTSPPTTLSPREAVDFSAVPVGIFFSTVKPDELTSSGKESVKLAEHRLYRQTSLIKIILAVQFSKLQC